MTKKSGFIKSKFGVNIRADASIMSIVMYVLSTDVLHLAEVEEHSTNWYKVRLYTTTQMPIDGYVAKDVITFVELKNEVGSKIDFLDLPIDTYPTIVLNDIDKEHLSKTLGWLSEVILNLPSHENVESYTIGDALSLLSTFVKNK